MNNYYANEIKNSEEIRTKIVFEFLEDYNLIHEKMSSHYFSIISSYEQERRQLIKYLGTIAGGSVALAPQLLNNVLHIHYLYLGILFLLLVVIVSISYTLSLIENGLTFINQDYNKKIKLFDELRKPKLDYIEKSDRQWDDFVKAMSSGGNIINEEKSKISNKMDYANEYITFFTVLGLSLVVLSLIQFQIHWYFLILIYLIIFIIINIISTYPSRAFEKLGWPIEKTKVFLKNMQGSIK